MAKRRESQFFVEIPPSTSHFANRSSRREEQPPLSRKRSIVEVVITSTPLSAKRLKTISSQAPFHTHQLTSDEESRPAAQGSGRSIQKNHRKSVTSNTRFETGISSGSSAGKSVGDISRGKKAQHNIRTAEIPPQQLLKLVPPVLERVSKEAKPKGKLSKTGSSRSENTSPLEATVLNVKDASKDFGSKLKSKQPSAERTYNGADSMKQLLAPQQVAKPKSKRITSRSAKNVPTATAAQSTPGSATPTHEAKDLSRPVPKKSKHMANPYPTPGISRTGSPIIPPPLPVVRPRPPPPPFTPLTPMIGHDPLLDRLFIREFVLRFKDTMTVIGRANMLEVANLATGGLRINHQGHEDMEEDQEGWISPQAMKSILVSVLGLFTAEGEAGNDVIKGALKDLRNAGSNLNKMWSILSDMRNSLSSALALVTNNKNSRSNSNPLSDIEDWSVLTFPDPVPPPSDAPIPVATRSAQLDKENVIQIIDTTQLIPPLIGIMNEALSTARCRQTLENGAEEIREIREPLREENKRWNEQKKALDAEIASLGEGEDVAVNRDELLSKLKVLKAEHKARADRLEQERDVWVYTCQPRFNGHLGCDEDGREYWALTPTPSFYQTKSKVKNEVIPRPIVLVWGKQNQAEDERWYAFDDPMMVKKLAAWLGPGEGRKDNEELVSGLKSYIKIMEAMKTISSTVQ